MTTADEMIYDMLVTELELLKEKHAETFENVLMEMVRTGTPTNTAVYVLAKLTNEQTSTVKAFEQRIEQLRIKIQGE